MFTCTPISDVEYYIDSVGKTDEMDMTAGDDQSLAPGISGSAARERGDCSGRDRAAYYLDNGVGEKPGIWWSNSRAGTGRALPFVRHGDEVDSEDFRSLARGIDPLTKTELVQATQRRRVGYDLQFAAPKSVSVLWAAGTNNQRDVIESAQQKAVFAALEYALENGFIVTRRGKNGSIRETPTELMAGTFLHSTSRSGDPQIHTHAVLLNMCRRKDGTTGTIDNKELLVHQQEMGAVYRLVLTQELERNLGIRTAKEKRNFRVIGVAESLERRFSKRRDEIEAEARRMGIDTTSQREAARNISMNTREAKSELPSRSALRSKWDREIRLEGWTRESIWESVHAAAAIHDASPKDHASAFERALAELVDTQSVIEDRHLIGTVLEHCQGRQMTFEKALEESHAARRSERLIELTGNDPAKTRNLNYAPPEIIDAEREIIRIAVGRRNEREFVSPDIVERAISNRGTISDEQAGLVRHALNRDGVSVVEGSAGTGKSFSLGTAARAARDAGLRVWVTAQTHQAVSVIARDTDTNQSQSAVLRAFLNRISDDQHGQAITLTRNDVVIVDESGMVGTSEMRELLRAVSDSGAKVILSGDTRQLKPVAPGSPMRLLAETLGTQRIDEIRRQRKEWQRAASKDFATGAIEKAVHAYSDHDRIVIGEGSELRQLLAGDYIRALKRGPAGTQVALARTHSEVQALNADLRRHVKGAGLIADADDIEVLATSRGRKPISGSLGLVAGDRIIFGENIRAGRGGQTIRNNDLATIKNIRRDRDGHPIVTMKFDRGFEVTTRWDELERMNQRRDGKDERPIKCQHAYAVTIHSAQGASVDRSFVLDAAGLDRELLYVSMTRHKEDCHLYTDTTRIGLNMKDNRVRRDGVSVGIDREGKLKAPDAAERDLLDGDAVNYDIAIKQIIYEGMQSANKNNAADFVMDRTAWANAPSAQVAVQNDIEMRQAALKSLTSESDQTVKINEMEIAEGKGMETAPERPRPTKSKEEAKEAARNAETAANETKRQAEVNRQQSEPGRSR